MNPQINIQCPSCNSIVDHLKHRGMIINQARSLGSQLVSLREQESKLLGMKPSKNITKMDLEEQRVRMRMRIEKIEQEQRMLLALENNNGH